MHDIKHVWHDQKNTWNNVRLVNASPREGIFPNALKHAMIRPRLKILSLDRDAVNSYRPISNLSFVSKMVEWVVVSGFDELVETQHLLPDRQSAYRATNSTETAGIAVHDSIVRTIDSGDVFALVLRDLSLAFDTVVIRPHVTHVLQQRFGVEGPTLTWFGSYLRDRTQAFYHNTQQSGPYRVDCSVPQGSVLDPKEFIAYTEELAVLIDSYQLGQHLYADDAQLMKPTRITNVASPIQTSAAMHRGHSSIRGVHPDDFSRIHKKTEVIRMIWHNTQF